MSSRTVLISTAVDGTFAYERPWQGVIKGVLVLLGDLTTPDIVVSDGTYGVTVLEVFGLAASTRYQPVAPVCDDLGATILNAYAPPAILGTLKVEVTGGGASKHGSIRFLT